jgi:hypothetical protein
MITRRTALALLVSAATLAGARAMVFAHPGHDHKVLGTVTMAAADHVMLKDKDGKDHTIKINAATKITKDKRRATIDDVKVGARVVVTAVEEKTGMIAKLIEVGAAPTAK